MAQELDYIKIKAGTEKAKAYSKDLEKLRINVEKDNTLTKENITKSISDSFTKMTQDLKLSTKDKQELINNLAAHSTKTINLFIPQNDKKLDATKLAESLTGTIKQSEAKRSISKSVIGKINEWKEKIQEAKNDFVKRAQEGKLLKKKEPAKKEGPDR